MILNEAELKRLIRDAVREVLNAPEREAVVYLTVQDVMKRLNISRAFCDRLIREEGLPIVRIGASIRVRSSSLDQWMNNREEISK